MSDKNKLDFINLKLEDLNPKLVKSFKRSFTILHYVSFLNKKAIINETRLIGPTTYVFIAKRKEFAEDKGLIIKKSKWQLFIWVNEGLFFI